MTEINSELEFEQTEFLNSVKLTAFSGNVLLNSALHYAVLGYPVFPLHNVVSTNDSTHCSCMAKADCTNVAKHPRTKNGFEDATTDSAKIIEWWTKFPNSNIGLVTGKESGIFVLDIDTKGGGVYSLDDLEDYYREMTKEDFESTKATLTAESGSGGKHYYFKYLLDFGVNSSVGKLGDGLDIRGDSGYIVAPPSRHLSLQNYQWFGKNTPILDAPSWLIYELVKAEQKVEVAEIPYAVSSKKKGEKIHEGQRQNELFRYICGLVNNHGKDEILTKALEKNRSSFVPSFSEGYVKKQVEYLFNKYENTRPKNMGLKK